MAYEFVCESEAKRYRSDCSNVLKETCELLKEKGISAQFSLVGSGARNMITRNGDGPYDLDYNLLVMKADNEYRDPRLLKDTIRNALNKAVGGKFFSDAQDSTSCLTAILYFEKSPDIKFKFDVAITTKNKNGNYMRLIHNKNVYALGLDQSAFSLPSRRRRKAVAPRCGQCADCVAACRRRHGYRPPGVHRRNSPGSGRS